jgi:hypothetical protein
MRSVFLTCFAALFLAGCGIKYTYSGKTYNSANEALAAAQTSNDDLVTLIKPVRNRIGGTLHYYMPNREAILERGIRKTGEPRKEITDYIADTSTINYTGLYNALVKRNAYDRVVLHYSSGEHIDPKPGEYVLYLYQPNVQSTGWYFVSDSVSRESVQFDTSKADRLQRVEYWLSSVDALARIK